MDTVRVFLSFDAVHDEDLKGRLLGEAAEPWSGFEVLAWSEPAEMDEAWSARVRRRISASDEVIVVCGEHTQDSPQIAAEIDIAREEEKPYFLVWGRREAMCTKPIGSKPSDGMYSWTTRILREQIAATIRIARSEEVPDRLKRWRGTPS
jgi:hypothetical protein